MAIIQDIENLSNDIDTARAGHFNTYKFGYLGEINAKHNTNYPLLLLLPPTSVIQDAYQNHETLSCEFHCYMRQIDIVDNQGNHIQPQQDTVALERTFDFLYTQFIATLQNLVYNNEHKYIITGGLNVTRVSQEFNDDLVGIIVSVDFNKFSHCLEYDPPNPIGS